MRELDFIRRVDRERAQRAAGVYTGPNLMTKAAVENAHADHDVERLPELWMDGAGLQTAGGRATFMVDWSAIDGPDPIK